MNSRIPILVPLLAIAIAVAACHNGDSGGGADDGNVTGVATKGIVSNADVAVYRFLDTGARGELLGSGTTAADGNFDVDVGGIDEVVWVEVGGGSYLSEATGASVPIDADRPLLGAGIVEDGVAGLSVSFLSHLVAMRARRLAEDPQVDAVQAVETARDEIARFYGIENPLTTVPALPTGESLSAGNASDYGALLAGLSTYAENRSISSMDLIYALGRDVSDGDLDGRFLGTPIDLPAGGALEADAAYAGLGQAIRTFLASNPRNTSGLTALDVDVDETLVEDIDTPTPSLPEAPVVETITPTSGPTGSSTTVTVTGRHLANAEVRVDGIPVTVTERADDRLVFVVPSGAAGPVDIRIVDLGTGLYTVVPAGFTRFAPDQPEITTLVPDHGPVAGGTRLEIHGSGFDADTTVSIGTQTVAIVDADLPDRIVVVTPPAAAGGVNVVVSNGLGSDSASFEYRESEAGRDVPPDAVVGNWHVFSFGREAGNAFTSSDLRLDIGADGGVGVTGTTTRRSVPLPDGEPTARNETWSSTLFPDGTLVLEEGDGTITDANLDATEDVFVSSLTTTPGRAGILVGVRAQSDARLADVAGSYEVRGTGDAFGGFSAGLTAVQVSGTLYLEAEGGGSLSLLVVRNDGENAVVEEEVSPLTWTVGADGGLAVETDSGLTIDGAVNRGGDFGAGLFDLSDRGTGICSFVRTGFGGAPNLLGRTFTGAAFVQRFVGDGGNRSPAFVGSRVVLVGDLVGNYVLTSIDRSVVDSDPTVPDTTLDDVVSGRFAIAPSGRLVAEGEGPVLDRGVVSASGRFLLLSPAAAGVDADSPLGLAILTAEPSYYSTSSLAGDYHFVSDGQTMTANGTTPSPAGTVESATGSLNLDPTTPATIGGRPFGLGGTAVSSDANRRVVSRDATGAFTSTDVPRGQRTGGYVVSGDGRVILFADDGSVADTGRFTTGNDPLDLGIGTLSPNADVAMLDAPTLATGATNRVVLVRQATNMPTLSGSYFAGSRMNGFYDKGVGNPTAYVAEGFGTATFNGGTLDLALDRITAREEDTMTFDTVNRTDTVVTDPNGRVQVFGPNMTLRQTGYATPGGDAVFLQDVRPPVVGTDAATGSSVFLRQNQNPTSFVSPATYRTFGSTRTFDATTTPATSVLGRSEGLVQTLPGEGSPNPFGGAGGTASGYGLYSSYYNRTPTQVTTPAFLQSEALNIDPTGAATGALSPTPTTTGATRGGFADTGRYYVSSGPTTGTASTAAPSGYQVGIVR